VVDVTPETLTSPPDIRPGRFDIGSFSHHQQEYHYGIISQNSNDMTDQAVAHQALIFVPGLGGSVKGALDFLTGLLPVYNPIVAMDLPGFGLNSHLLPQSPKYYTHLLDAFWQSEAIQEALANKPFAVAGISLGGSTATHWASQHPKRFSQLILIAPAFKASRYSFPLTFVLRHVLKRAIQGRSATLTLPYDINSLTRNQTFLDGQQQHFQPLTLPVDFMLAIDGFNTKARRLCRKLHTSTLMLVPGQDKVCCPKAMKQAFQSIPAPNKQLKVYPDAYHDLLIEPELPTLIEDIQHWSSKNH